MTAYTVVDLLDERVEHSPDRPFLWCEGHRYTYREADEASDRVAAGLRSIGVGHGDRIALLSPNRMELLELYLAAAKIGAVQVPLNAFLKGEFLRYQLADAGATMLVTDVAGWRAAAPLVDQLPDLRHVVLLDDDVDTVVTGGPKMWQFGELRCAADGVERVGVATDDLMSIVYTSGTTGLPKGCMLPHGYYVRVARRGVEFFDLHESDVHLTAMPLFHAAARLLVVGSAMCVGSNVAVMGAFSPRRVLELAPELGATVFGGVGAMGAALLNLEPSELDRANRIRLGWFIPMAPDAQRELKDRFGFADVTTELYGQTECFPAVFNPLCGPRDPASDGREPPDLEIRIADDAGRDVPLGTPGEILIRPRHRNAMFRGYWRREEATLEAFRDLWYHTGDFGRRDERGFVSFVDRKRDAIRRRGENVSSVELEAAIAAHPKIAEVAVHAVPSELSEDEIKACVVLEPGEELSAAEAFEHFRTNLPYFAIPRYLEVLPELPRNAVARVMKHQLRDRGITSATLDLEQLGFTVAKSERR